MAASESDDLRRNKLLSRLLAESLAANAANGRVCPDAETMAAYADHGLPAEIMAQLDVHFASCVRCQQVIVALALTSDELPARVAALQPQPQPAPLPFPTPSPKPRFAQTHWRWLAPAAAIAAAVAIWFALRPAPPIQTLSARNEAPSIQAPSAQGSAQNNSKDNSQSNSESNSNSAESNIPVPLPPIAGPLAAPAPAKASPQEPQEFSAGALKKTERAEQPQNSEKPAAPPALPAPKAEPRQPSQSEQNATALAGGNGAGALAATSLPAVPTSIARIVPLSSGQPPASNSPAGSAGQAKSAQANGNEAIVSALARPLALPAARTVIFAAPGGAALWRIGPGGSIERSTDQGRTWEKQTSGVASDLTAGVAISGVSAWIVGRSGVILRTADGISWQRVLFSSGTTNGTTPDFAGIDARDTLHATVTTTGGHHFATQDGGQTWTAQ